MKFHLNAPQTRIIDALEDNEWLLFGAGVGTGKTTLLAIIATILAKENPGFPGLVVGHLNSLLDVEIVPALLKFLRAAKLFKKHKVQKKILVCTNGSTIQYASADNEASIEGRNVAWLVADELRFWKRRSWIRAIARPRIVDAPMFRIVCGSTLETNWMMDEWKDKEDRHVIYAATYENEHNLRRGYIPDLKASLSPQMFEQYVMARWIAGSATVYGAEFTKEKSITNVEHIPGTPVLIGMDPGILTPAVVFAQRFDVCPVHHRLDCLHIIGELVPNETPLTRLIPMIRDLAGRNQWKLGELYLDPFGGNAKEQIYGTTVAEKLEEAGFVVEFSYDRPTTNVLNGIAAVQSRLLNMAGERRLYISSSLDVPGLTSRNLCRAIQSYRWPERKPGAAVKSNPIHDETSHVMDALRYLVVNLFPPLDCGVKVV